MQVRKLVCIFIIILVLLLGSTIVKAESATITATSYEVEEGTPVTIKVSFTAASWSLTVSGDKISGGSYASNASDLSETTTNKEFVMDTSKEGTYKVLLKGDITNKDGNTTEVEKSITVKVNKKVEQTPPKQEEPPAQNTTPTTPQEQPKPTVTFSDVNKTMYATTGLNVRESYDANSEKVGYLNKGDSIEVIGKGSNGWYKVKINGKEAYAAGTYLTEEKPKEEKSSTATLSNITLKSGNLNETFSKDKLSYTMTVEADVDKVDITATPTDNKAKVTITGNTALTTGTGNTINIKVLAEDGISTKTYSIKVTKLATEDEDPNIIEEPKEDIKLGLKSLEIKGLKLTPNFKNDIYEYTATLNDMTVEKLDINAVSSIDDAKVEITGADEIKEGENVITITVSSKDGEQTITYQITVTKKEVVATTVPKVETEKNNGNGKILLAVGAGLAIVALILVLVIIKKKEDIKPVKIYEDGDYNEIEEQQEDEEYSENEDDEEDDNDIDDDDDDDDDWGTPKRGFRSKFRKTGRHF